MVWRRTLFGMKDAGVTRGLLRRRGGPTRMRYDARMTKHSGRRAKICQRWPPIWDWPGRGHALDPALEPS